MWTDANTLALVDEYRRHPCLWDPADMYFKILSKKSDAWKEVAAAMQCNVPEIKRKMASVLASFRRERKRGGKSTWFAYRQLSFLLDKFNSNPKKVKTAEEEEDEYFIEPGEWWNEHESLNDEQDLLLTAVEVENKADIIKFHDLKEDISTSAPVAQNDVLGDTEDTNSQLQRKQPSRRKRIRTSKYSEDQSEDPDNTVNMCLRKNDDFAKRKSISEVFAAYVAAKLETYSVHKQNMVQHKINEILFQADMGDFEKTPQLQQMSQMEVPATADPLK